jgi:hypothetical protein
MPQRSWQAFARKVASRKGRSAHRGETLDQVHDLDICSLYQSLHFANWGVAARTFGSSHATLIGLLVEWWLRQDPTHTALDGAPSHGTENAGWCDVMFLHGGMPAGVLEVEGTKPFEKLRTIERYFASRREELGSIQFGLLMLYSYSPRGRGSERTYPPAETPAIYSEALRLSSAHRQKPLILIALDKVIDEHGCSIRSTSPYYAGRTHTVTAAFLRGGVEEQRDTLFFGA